MASASALVAPLSSQADEDRGDKWGPLYSLDAKVVRRA